MRACRIVSLAGGGQGLVDGWLEAAHMLHSGTVCLHRLHVLVEDGKDLIVQDLVLPDAVGHLLKGLQKDKEVQVSVGGGGRDAKEKQQNSARLGIKVLMLLGLHHLLRGKEFLNQV